MNLVDFLRNAISNPPGLEGVETPDGKFGSRHIDLGWIAACKYVLQFVQQESEERRQEQSTLSSPVEVVLDSGPIKVILDPPTFDLYGCHSDHFIVPSGEVCPVPSLLIYPPKPIPADISENDPIRPSSGMACFFDVNRNTRAHFRVRPEITSMCDRYDFQSMVYYYDGVQDGMAYYSTRPQTDISVHFDSNTSD